MPRVLTRAQLDALTAGGARVSRLPGAPKTITAVAATQLLLDKGLAQMSKAGASTSAEVGAIRSAVVSKLETMTEQLKQVAERTPSLHGLIQAQIRLLSAVLEQSADEQRNGLKGLQAELAAGLDKMIEHVSAVAERPAQVWHFEIVRDAAGRMESVIATQGDEK